MDTNKNNSNGEINTATAATATAAGSACRAWAESDPLMLAYHDDRWCRPVHEDRELFAMLCLEGMQAGLSWLTIIRKEAAIREAFDGFDIDKVASYDENKVEALLGNPEIIRSRAKIRAVIANARAVQRITAGVDFATFDEYVWHFTSGKRIVHRLADPADTPAKSDLSERVSADMKKRGFKYVGPVICYSYLQGIGVIDDHLDDCPCKIWDE